MSNLPAAMQGRPLPTKYDAYTSCSLFMGIGTLVLSESDNKEVAAKIQDHVASMHQRIKDGRGLRFWYELFVAIFHKHASISMTVDKTEKGVKVVETSDDKAAVILIQARDGRDVVQDSPDELPVIDIHSR